MPRARTLVPVAGLPAFLDHPRPLAFAHRGGGSEATENSWAAFEHAVSLGYSYIETDVRATSDEVPVAFHDSRLERLTGSAGLLSDTTSKDLGHARLADGGSVPRLEDLLAAWPELRWNIDVKCPRATGPVIEALRRTNAGPRVLVTAFSARRVARLRQALGPAVATGASALGVAGLLLARRAHLAPTWARCSAAQVPVNFRGQTVVDAGFVETCHSARVQVHVWTVDDPAEMARLLDLGVDGLMTDRPSALRELLISRGQWA
ncbi:MAG: glycerophosphodiester phosphodiesterase family protein [Acidimicrobiales bacterium]